MRKFALYLIALVTAIIYGLACSPSFMKFFVDDWKNTGKPELLQFDKYKYGDLYGMSYLSKFKTRTGDLYNDERIERQDKTFDLWIIGDSFLYHALNPKKHPKFLKNAEVKYFWWQEIEKSPVTIELNPERKNVLLVEVTERLVKTTFTDQKAVNFFSNIYQTSPVKYNNDKPPVSLKQKIGDLSQSRLVPQSFNQNIELLLFGYEIFAPAKELKSEINYRLFSRISPEVNISENGQNLFYRPTVNSDEATSSFHPLSDFELDEIVRNLNFIAESYKSKGFDEVVLSIPPNAVTIVNPEMGVYNNLIPRLQSHPNLMFKVIDVYSKLKFNHDSEELYWRNDSHWNSNGFRLWVDEANYVFQEISNNTLH